MVLTLIRIIKATTVHPKTGILIGTIRQGLEDLWHFPILFVLVLGFSAMVSAWSFNNRPELEDLHASMNTQFDMLLEILPEGYETDPLLAVYVVLSATVHFFLMLNFLLAIIVENYMKVREKIKGMHTENEMTYDVGLTIYHYMLGIFYRWSRRRRIRGLIAFRCAKKSISWLELYVLGVSEKAAVSLIDSFAAMPAVKSSAPVKKRTEAEQGLDATKSTSINVRLLEKATKASDQRQTRSDDGTDGRPLAHLERTCQRRSSLR